MDGTRQPDLPDSPRDPKLHSSIRGSCGWTSENWSGYAIQRAGQAITCVSGRWRVPTVKPSSIPSYSSSWLGIDGFLNRNLIQVGTEQDYVRGRPVYYAWWEILPGAEQRITSVQIRPGDVVFAEVRHLRAREWAITLRNVTRGQQFVTIQDYEGPRSSAEWIVEAPEVGGQVTRLAKYQSFAFEQCRVNGRPARFTPTHSGAMEQEGHIASAPLLLSPSQDGFQMRYLPFVGH